MNTRQVNFAYRLRRALNENLDSLPASTTERLAQARAAALARKKAEAPERVSARRPALAGNSGGLGGGLGGGLFGGQFSWLGRIGVALPMAVVAAGIFALYQAESQKRIADVAEIDALVLADELPLNAYLDNGFNAYLEKGGAE